MTQKETFTLVIFMENTVGLLNRITSLLSQRHINIESITASESEIADVYRLTMVILEDKEKVEKLCRQIEKQVEVLKAFSFTDEKSVFSEIALYKIGWFHPKKEYKLQEIVVRYNLKVLANEPLFRVFEKTGTEKETRQVYEALKPYGLEGFVRSGRVSLSKSVAGFKEFLKASEQF